MILQQLALRNFRNYKEAVFTFSSNVNCILGGNAQGKTNLLEALFFLSTGRSFRTSHITHLIREGAPSFHIEAHYVRDGVNQVLKLSFDGKKRTFFHNQTACKSSADLFGQLPVIIYSPEDVQLISGPPSKRRRFLDMHIAQGDPLYVFHLVRYFRAMKQRNALLKADSQDTIINWEQQMAHSAAYLVEQRERSIESLLPTVQNNLKTLSGASDHVSLGYKTNVSFKEFGTEISSVYTRQFESLREKELIIGSTLIGPHKDDLTIHLNAKEAKIYSSEGQKRSCALALRLSEWQRLNKVLGVAPLLCLDDFGSHLDEKRQTVLQEQLPHFGQVFLTSPTQPLSLLPSESTHTLHIQEGTLQLI